MPLPRVAWCTPMPTACVFNVQSARLFFAAYGFLEVVFGDVLEVIAAATHVDGSGCCSLGKGYRGLFVAVRVHRGVGTVAMHIFLVGESGLDTPHATSVLSFPFMDRLVSYSHGV